MNTHSIIKLAKPAYQDETLTRPDWTIDISRKEEMLWLDKNENLDPELNKILQNILLNFNPNAINTYPETAKIYKKLAEQNQMHPQNFILTNGSDGSIRMMFDVFISPGDKVVYTNPTFAMYAVYSKMFGALARPFNYERVGDAASLNIARYFDFIKNEKPKMVCLPNPDSPTGTVISDSEMLALIALTNELGILLLIDEAYFPFYNKTVIQLVNKFPNLFVCRTFSKAWGAAGVRVGYLAGHPDLMKIIHKNRAMYEMGTLSSEFIYALIDQEREMKKSVTRLLEAKKFFTEELLKLDFKILETHGNFLHVDFGSKKEIIEAALKPLVLYRSSFKGTCLEGYSRFSLGTKEQFETIIKKIRSVL